MPYDEIPAPPLRNTVNLLWRTLREVRNTSARTTSTARSLNAARLAVEELTTFALDDGHPGIRRAAVAAIRTALTALNPASRCAAMVALLDINDRCGRRAVEV